MGPLQILRVAARALLRNKMRSALTALGVIIGVGAVIAMMAIGEGAKTRVRENFEKMGTNLLVVLSGSSNSSGAMGGFGSMPTLTWDDLRAMRELSAVRHVAPVLQTAAQLVSEAQNWRTQITGTYPDYFSIRAWFPEQGALFAPSDAEGGAKVVVIGRTVAEKLWGVGADPVGQPVRIRGVPFVVVGVLARKGQSPMGQDLDDAAFVPAAAFTSKLQGGLKNYVGGAIFVGAADPDETARAARQISELLRERHHIEAQDDDFSVRNLTEMAEAMQGATKTLTTLLAAIAAVSLLVGGIGIMNIMLVSVTERTREIGLRMAVGATSRGILLQFLIEALVLALLGGGCGVGLGLLVARQLAAAFGWAILVRPEIVAISFVFSGGVGVIFGLYPAHRASRLDPIDALRYE